MFFCEFCENSKNNFFYKTPPVAAFEHREKKYNIRSLKKNNQAFQIICLFVVSRYNFHYLSKLFIKSFGW